MSELNPGIVRAVTLLNAYGYRTTDSGDGETHDHDCDRDVGYVVVVLNSYQALEQGSVGIHIARRGEDGSFWIEDAGDLWPSSPVMFRYANWTDEDGPFRLDHPKRLTPPPSPQGEP